MARVTPCMGTTKKHILVDPFFTWQFSYCPPVWIYHSLANNNKINKRHERFLQIFYNDKRSSFYRLLKMDGSVSIYMKTCDMSKLINNLSPPIMNRVFKLNSDIRYNLR